MLPARAQLLRDDHAEILERREDAMELLERFVRGAVAEALDEDLRVENVFSRCPRRPSGSGGVVSIPCIARVCSHSAILKFVGTVGGVAGRGPNVGRGWPSSW